MDSKSEVIVGRIWMGNTVPETVIKRDYSGNYINSIDELKDWAHCLNNPWSGTSMNYAVYPNYSGEGWAWIACKEVIVYDSLTACIEAGGNTPQEAITRVDEFIEEVTESYYDETEDE